MMRPAVVLVVLVTMVLAGCGGGNGDGAGTDGGNERTGDDRGPTGVPTGNRERGALVYETCAACHALHADPDEFYFGPPLAGIIGRQVAADPEFAYSDAMRAFGGKWTEERLAAYLRAPEEEMPGTQMVQALPDSQDVLDVIAYLKSEPAAGEREFR